jgi:hypothetical protein
MLYFLFFMRITFLLFLYFVYFLIFVLFINFPKQTIIKLAYPSFNFNNLQIIIHPYFHYHSFAYNFIIIIHFILFGLNILIKLV